MIDDAGFERMLDELYPYRQTNETFRVIPEQGRPVDDVLAEVRAFAAREDAMGDEGRVSGSLYCGDHEHYHVLTEVFEEFAHVNVLQRDMYPSATKFEAEIIAMVAEMLHGTGAGSDVCGVVTSGGSESLITALYTYREQAAAERGISRPNVVIPVTAHVALDKGAHWLGIEMRHAPLTAEHVVDVEAMAALVDENTIAIVGSAGNYAHGLIDPIPELGRLALGAGHRPARRRVSRRLPAPVDRGDGGRGAAVGLPGPRRDEHQRRHAQVRIRAEGHVHPHVPHQGAACAPVVHLPGLAGRPLPVARLRRLAQRWSHRLDLGLPGADRPAGIPRRRRADP